MRASLLRRGLIALAAVGMISTVAVQAASADSYVDRNDAVVVHPNPGYNATFVNGPTDPVAIILTSNGAGSVPLAVQFVPNYDGATIITPGVGWVNVNSK